MFLKVCNLVSMRFKNRNVLVYMVDMVTLSEDFEMTWESMELS
jgi:hypothetical protein